MTTEGALYWTIAVGAAVVYELVAVFTKKATPMTTVVRSTLLRSKWGSAAVGAFLVWLGYHWGFDTEGLDFLDGLFLVIGSGLGLLGHDVRHPRP